MKSQQAKMFRAFINNFIKVFVGRVIFGAYIKKAPQVSRSMHASIQYSRFLKIYGYAKRFVAFYQSDAYPQASSLKVYGNVYEALKMLPILPKVTLKENQDEFLGRYGRFGVLSHTTSGTSGTPLKIQADILARSFNEAIMSWWYESLTHKRFPRTLTLSGFMSPSADSTELYWEDKGSKNIFLSIYALSESNKEEIVKILNRHKPDMIYGYSSSVAQLAQLLEPGDYGNKSSTVAVVTSEVLQPGWRDTIESSLCRQVYNNYGSQEMSHRIIECDQRSLHIHPYVGIVELLDENDRPVSEGQSGRVVITGLINFAMPLIRYDIGDSAIAVSPHRKCNCGLEWPMIGEVDGRREDLVTLRDGRKIALLAFHTTKNLPKINFAQIIQRSYEIFEINLVIRERTIDLSAIELSVAQEIKNRCQLETVHIKFNYVETIPTGPRGKFKAVIVDFKQTEIEEYKVF